MNTEIYKIENKTKNNEKIKGYLINLIKKKMYNDVKVNYYKYSTILNDFKPKNRNFIIYDLLRYIVFCLIVSTIHNSHITQTFLLTIISGIFLLFVFKLGLFQIKLDLFLV